MCSLHALRHKASADDGKRALAQLEVDVSPLKATKGGSLRRGRATKRRQGCRGSVDDGKRAPSVLEVDSSPLRATKGGSSRGGRAIMRFHAAGVGGFYRFWVGFGRLFRSCG